MKNLSLTFCLAIAALLASVGSGFASDLPPCPSSGYRNNCFGTYNWSNGDKYFGEFKEGNFNGQGTFTYADGDKYFGEWKEDKKHGQGTDTWGPNSEWAGDKYVGEYKDNIRNGQGTYYFASGDKYVGEYKDNKRNGQGTYTWASGGKYVGEYKDDKANGQGTYTFTDGTVKEGIWKDGEFQYAKKLSPPAPVTKTPTQDDEIISASSGSGFASDLPPCPSSGYFDNCFGTYTHVNGDKYVGEFRDDKYNGQGTYTFGPNSKWAGDKYVGEYKNGSPNGQGIKTYADGDKYVGEFKDNKKNGQGTYTWANGDKYVGEFKNDASNGQGTYTFANGSVKEGIFKDWKFQYAKKLSPPVPAAKTPTQDDEIISASSGSGFAVSSDDYVITNHHVIEGCQKVVVHTKEKDLTVRVITYDPQNDLALLKGDFRPQTVFPLSNNRPELLQDIYVAGYPFGNKVSTSVKVTKGIISSLTGIGNNFSNIQIDAALQSGNSGGPILDDLGNVVGVAVSKLDAKYMFDNFGSIPENTNFGIKSIIVRSVLDSNEVDSPPANQSEISKSKLGKMISSGTYYISCWMTMAQIEKMKTKKVFFSELD